MESTKRQRSEDVGGAKNTKKGKKSGNQHRNWCVTWNDDGFANSVGTNPPLNEGCFKEFGGRYAVFQVEKGDSGNYHLQAYLEFSRPVTLKNAQRSMADYTHASHLEVRKGTREQARAYCKKADSRVAGPWEFGNFDEGMPAFIDLDEIDDNTVWFRTYDGVEGRWQVWRRAPVPNVWVLEETIPFTPDRVQDYGYGTRYGVVVNSDSD